MTSQVIDRDRGYAAFVKQFTTVKGKQGRVGIFAGKNNKEGKSIAEYATYNEFGATITSLKARMWLRHAINRSIIEGGATTAKWSNKPVGYIHIPERSFLRSTYDEQRQAVIKVMRARLQKATKQELISGKLFEICLKTACQWLVDQVKRKISDSKSWASSNSKVTVFLKSKHKGKDQPLMDTGAMRAAVTYQITTD